MVESSYSEINDFLTPFQIFRNLVVWGTIGDKKGIMLGKEIFLFSKSVCNRQSNLTKLGITINWFDILQSNLTK